MDAVQSESRKRIQSQSDIKKDQEKIMDDLRAREQNTLQQVSKLQSDKQRLEDTIYRLKTEAVTTKESLRELREQLHEEKQRNVSCMKILVS